MRKLLNTLFVTTQGAYLAKDGETVAVRVDGEMRLRLPVHTLEGVICFGQVSASPFLLGFCAEHGVGVGFLTEHGRFLARVQGPVKGNVLLRRQQYRLADDPGHSTHIARAIVSAKVANARSILLRAAREDKDSEDDDIRSAVKALASVLARLEQAPNLDGVRGLEGEAAHRYFAAFEQMVVANREAFSFSSRSRRPPLDPMNALLSFVYTLLRHDCESACEGVGLDPAVGFLHRDRPGRTGLALDLMEEFRACLADRLVLTLINRKQVQPKGFKKLESGAVLMDDATRKEVLTAWQQRKREEIVHPFLEESVPIGLLPHAQALLMARHIRGDLDAYPAFFWR